MILQERWGYRFQSANYFGGEIRGQIVDNDLKRIRLSLKTKMRIAVSTIHPLKSASSDERDRHWAFRCPLCNDDMEWFGVADYQVDLTRLEPFAVWHCRGCDLFSRSVTADVVARHFDVVTYMQPDNEPRMRSERTERSEWILDLMQDRLGSKLRSVLDVGCGLGHLLQVGKLRGYAMDAVELNDGLATRLGSLGFRVWRRLDEVSGTYDAITFVDSFYYFPNPIETLARCKDLLHSNGLLLLRITNRNWLANWNTRRRTLELFGDATHSYSLMSMTKALTKSGLRLNEFLYRERVSQMSLRRKSLYVFGYSLTALSGKRWLFAPGLVLIAHRGDE